MDTTPDAAANGVAGAAPVQGAFADEHGRLRGVVLWYNVTLKFGFIVPEDPNAPVFRVMKSDITADSDADDVQALQTNEIVHFTPSVDGISALSVTNTKEGRVNFQKKLDGAAAELEARKLLMPHAQAVPHQGAPVYGMYPHGAMGGAPPHPKKRKGPPQLPIDEEKIVFGKVISWNPRHQWGHILPDEQLEADIKTAPDAVKQEESSTEADAEATSSVKKEEAGADASSSTDADGDATMNGEEAEVKGEEAEEKGPKKVKMAPIVAEIDQIEVPADRLPGLNRKSRVQFRVAKGPYPNTVTAIKVCNEDGTPIIFSTPSMERVQKKEPVEDTVYKGTVAFFMKNRSRPYGFLKPEGTTEKKDQVFCHIVETNFMPLKAGSEVEFKLAEDTGKGKSACCVTGPDGGLPEYVKPKKRPRPANPPSAAPAGPPHAGAPGWTFAPAPGGAGFHSFPPPGAGMWGPPADYYGGGDFYGAAPDYSWPPSNNYQVPWHHSPQQRRRSGNFNNKKRKKSASTANPVAAEERTCTVCNKTMTGIAPYNTHMAGKAHAKKVQQQMQAGGVAA